MKDWKESKEIKELDEAA